MFGRGEDRQQWMFVYIRCGMPSSHLKKVMGKWICVPCMSSGVKSVPVPPKGRLYVWGERRHCSG